MFERISKSEVEGNENVEVGDAAVEDLEQAWMKKGEKGREMCGPTPSYIEGMRHSPHSDGSR